MSFWKNMFKGGGERKPTLRTRLSLESLDGRVVPSGTPTDPPPGEPAQTPTNQVATVTDVSVLPVVNEQGEFLNLYFVLEKAGSEYVVSYLDPTTNTFFTGTDSAGTAVYTAATPELDQFVANYGVAGSAGNLRLLQADGQVLSTPTTQAGVPLANPQPVPTQAPGTPPPVPVVYPSWPQNPTVTTPTLLPGLGGSQQPISGFYPVIMQQPIYVYPGSPVLPGLGGSGGLLPAYQPRIGWHTINTPADPFYPWQPTLPVISPQPAPPVIVVQGPLPPVFIPPTNTLPGLPPGQTPPTYWTPTFPPGTTPGYIPGVSPRPAPVRTVPYIPPGMEPPGYYPPPIRR
jgi:hypothetical protein